MSNNFDKLSLNQLQIELVRYKNHPQMTGYLNSLIYQKKIYMKQKLEEQQMKDLDFLIENDSDDDISMPIEVNDATGLDNKQNRLRNEERLKEEVRKDTMNNNLTDRMNSEIDIRNIRRRTPVGDKNFIPPYTEVAGNYAAFNNVFTSDITSFSNNKSNR